MGDLPEERITVQSGAFQDEGLELGGPFFYEIQEPESNKAYLASFNSFVSEAIHLELVIDLTTAACIAAFRRFTPKKGYPEKMYLSNATNFTGS